MFWKRILYYLNISTLFKKRDGDKNINLSLMHGMNRISIVVFIVCVIIMLMKFL